MECHICYETVSKINIEILKCEHLLCTSCLGNLQKLLCPFCRTPILNTFTIPNILSTEINLNVVRRRRHTIQSYASTEIKKESISDKHKQWKQQNLYNRRRRSQ